MWYFVLVSLNQQKNLLNVPHTAAWVSISFLLYCQIVFNCMNTPHFIHPQPT